MHVTASASIQPTMLAPDLFMFGGPGMYWVGLAVLLLVIYVALCVRMLVKSQLASAALVEAQLKQSKEGPKESERELPYGWFDNGWPIAKGDEDERAPIPNPKVRATADEYASQMWMTEYRCIRTAAERIEFLRKLMRAEVCFRPDFLDLIYTDENVAVRAWAAAHLPTKYKDYPDVKKLVEFKNAIEIRDYEPTLLTDPEPIVRAALRSNPEFSGLPFSQWDECREAWQACLRQMTQLERLGMMRNPRLQKSFVLALLETSSDDLGISRKEHAKMLRAAALNPDLIGSSRWCGRRDWVVLGDPNRPFKEFGKMWDLCLDKWIEEDGVVYTFLSYIQTTPDKKMEVYKRLLDAGCDRTKVFRQAIINSCDPWHDKAVLKAAWVDPSEDCRNAAKERIGKYTKWIGVE